MKFSQESQADEEVLNKKKRIDKWKEMTNPKLYLRPCFRICVPWFE